MDRDDPGVRWLLDSVDPSVRYLTLRDVLRLPGDSRELAHARAAIPTGRRLRALLAGGRADGGFGVHWYKKWAGAQWRLVSAVELEVPPDHPAARRALDRLLSELPYEQREPQQVAGRYRLHASVIGNPIGVAARLGRASDPRVQHLARSLVAWQWPDGGWNCDSSPEATHASFYESLATLWGLTEYLRASGDRAVRAGVDRAAEFFLRHRLFQSCHGDAPGDPGWQKLHYPLYWHYDILQALRVLDRAGRIRDRRATDALDLLESKRRPDGSWAVEGRFWHLGDRRAGNTEVVDWGASGPNEMITLNALRVLRSAGRLS